MPRPKRAKQNGPSFYQTCLEAGQSDEEMKEAPPQQPAPAGGPSGRGSKRRAAVEGAIDVDELPGRHRSNAEKPHEHAGDEHADDGPERLPQQAVASGLPGTRSNVASQLASPLADPLKSPYRAPSRASSPHLGASGARRRLPSERLVNSRQQSAEFLAAKDLAARRRMGGLSPLRQVPKNKFHLDEGDEEQMASDGDMMSMMSSMMSSIISSMMSMMSSMMSMMSMMGMMSMMSMMGKRCVAMPRHVCLRVYSV